MCRVLAYKPENQDLEQSQPALSTGVKTCPGIGRVHFPEEARAPLCFCRHTLISQLESAQPVGGTGCPLWIPAGQNFSKTGPEMVRRWGGAESPEPLLHWHSLRAQLTFGCINNIQPGQGSWHRPGTVPASAMYPPYYSHRDAMG